MTAVASPSTAPVRRRDGAAPAAATRPDLSVVGRPRRDRPVGAIAAVAVIVLFGALFVNAIFHSVLVSGQAQLDKLDQQVADQGSSNQQLRLRVAGLESPERIVASAQRAGMQVPVETHWVMAQSPSGQALSSTSGLAAPPTDDTGSTGSTRGAGTDERAAGPTSNDDGQTVGSTVAGR